MSPPRHAHDSGVRVASASVRVAFAMGIVVGFAGRRALADPPPAVACVANGEPRATQWTIAGAAREWLVANDVGGDGAWIAIRASTTGRRGTTSMIVGRVGRIDAASTASPTNESPVTTPLQRGRSWRVAALRADGGVASVIIARGRNQSLVRVRLADGSAQTSVIASPRGRWRGSVPTTTQGDAFVRIWNGVDHALVQRIAAVDGSVVDSHDVRLPHGDVVTYARAIDDSNLALVVRTPGGRYVIARFGQDSRLHWTGNGPGGCVDNRCPEVRLRGSGSAIVATWEGPRTDDGLRTYGGRALDALGHSRGPAVNFVPMVHGVVVNGPQGQPLALQLGVPIVIRGTERPIAVSHAPHVPMPVLADALADATGLDVVALASDGSIALSRMRCTRHP